MPNGVDKEKPVEVAPDPWRGKTVSYAGLPAVKHLAFTSRVRSAIPARGKAVRAFRATATMEQFGAPVVRVTASSRTLWPHLVAVLAKVEPDGSETVLSDGGTVTRFGRAPRTVTFKLISDANLIARGARLRLYLGATSTVQSPRNLLYLKPVPDDSQLSIREVRLNLPVLRKAISG
jgi:hypothetical protein